MVSLDCRAPSTSGTSTNDTSKYPKSSQPLIPPSQLARKIKKKIAHKMLGITLFYLFCSSLQFTCQYLCSHKAGGPKLNQYI
ncbi:hypothetical protein XELAEV_18007892mg [Xenopus laevis]|uniref:Uncharacterized protein n=1 Tax=Xenopus laevis TaxID=8355 RepID=A0A974E2S4_XENLA|nr:hypothetical protein XELAEV_18007892mg [Xenopus laevis]